MIEKTLGEIAGWTGADIGTSEIADVKIKGVSINSQTVVKGNLFIPLKGERRDGHEFVSQAFENGAAASLWQKDVPDPPENVPLLFVDDTLGALQQLAKKYRESLPLKVVAVTGSNGKTTTKDMTAALLSARYKVQKTLGNYNNHIGLPLTVLSLKEETELAVVEMGMNHFGEIDLLTKIAKPDVAVITNIGDAHLQELGSREGIAEAKLEILNGLKNGGLFIYPGDEPLIRKKLGENSLPFEIRTFGKEKTNDIYVTKLEADENGSVFTVNQAELTFRLPVPGHYNVLNALAAMLVARHFQVSFTEINDAFARIRLTEMRMELSPGINGSRILNDAYNASPTSMKAVIDFVAGLTGVKKKIAVLGDMLELGPEERKYHREVGEHIDPEKIDYVYTYGGRGKWIAEGARTVLPASRVFSFTDKKELIRHLKPKLEPSTIVFVKASRGMKLEEVVKGITEPTDGKN